MTDDTITPTTTSDEVSDLDSILGEALGQVDTATAPETPPVAEAATETPTANPENPYENVPDDQVILSVFRDHLGDKQYGGKYRNDAEFIRGVYEQERLIGQRNEDAQFGRLFRENPQAFLQQYGQYYQTQTPPAQAPAQPAPAAKTMSFEEFRRMQSLVQRDPETGRLVPKPGAPPDVVDRIETEARRIQEAAFKVAQDPASLVRPTLQQELAQVRQAAVQEAVQLVQQQMAYQQQWQAATTEADSWIGQHAKEFFVEGDPQRGLTPLGAATREVFLREFNPVVQAGQLSPARAFEAARGIVLSNLPPAQPVTTPPATAQHKPNLANAPAAAPDPFAYRKGEDVDDYLDKALKLLKSGMTPS